MKTVTTHQAKTHLSRLLKEVQAGEVIIIHNGALPVAKLTAVEPNIKVRPSVGTLTSPPVRYTEDAFSPLSNEELREWDL
ncbi:MAG: type II toxin-antitoxin system prevent-host-death family antitoxin [Candidatus Latescibacterota bacterium]|jgi:prevent-host-death family protein